MSAASTYSPDCAFCAILDEPPKPTVILESPHTLAFFPLKPATIGHTLVIPRRHIRDLYDLEPHDSAPLMNALLEVAKAIKHALSPDGMNLINSSGSAASQTVFHLHMHLVPRWNGDRFGNIWPPSEPWNEEVKEGVAEAIRDALSERSAKAPRGETRS